MRWTYKRLTIFTTEIKLKGWTSLALSSIISGSGAVEYVFTLEMYFKKLIYVKILRTKSM